MLVYEDECVGCPPEMGCMGGGCPNLNVPHFLCDGCEKEYECYYKYDGEFFCKDCLLKTVLENAEIYTAEYLINRGGG